MWNELKTTLHRQLIKVYPEHSDSQALANSFVIFFKDKVDALTKKFESTAHPPSSFNGFTERVVSIESKLHTMEMVSEKELVKIIMNSPSKSSPQDPLPTWLLRKLLASLLPAIHSIVRLSLLHGLPSLYKFALITPIIKKDNLDKDTLGNYRPVSNLPFLSKVTERVVALRLQNHLNANKSNDLHQSAYRPHHSCETALLYIHSLISSSIDQGKVSLMVMIDLSAAFDTVSHNRLLKKLEVCGVVDEALNWVGHYLSGRSQAVQIKNSRSNSVPLTTGVPQGSVLGPLLFNAYIADISRIISPFMNIKYVMYADDLQLVTSCQPKNIITSLAELESCIRNVRQWLSDNYLVINDSKTELIVFGSRSHLKNLPQFHLQVGDVHIDASQTVRNLGVIFDSELRFDQHASKISRMCYWQLKLLTRYRRSLNKKTSKLLIDSLILSRVDYCVSLLYGVNDGVVNKLDRVIRACVRWLERRKRSDDITEIMKKSRVLNVRQRTLLRLSLIIRTCFTTSLPTYLHDLLEQPQHSDHALRSSSQGLLFLHRTRTEMGKRAFQIVAAKVWNQIPHSIRQSTSQTSFRANLVEFLLETQ
jgi:hypothetical protein